MVEARGGGWGGRRGHEHSRCSNIRVSIYACDKHGILNWHRYDGNAGKCRNLDSEVFHHCLVGINVRYGYCTKLTSPTVVPTMCRCVDLSLRHPRPPLPRSYCCKPGPLPIGRSLIPRACRQDTLCGHTEWGDQRYTSTTYSIEDLDEACNLTKNQ